MAASRHQVDKWIDKAKKNKHKYIISVCDTWDWNDYPVYCNDDEELREEYLYHDNLAMQKINEIIQVDSDGTVKENLHISQIL